MYYELPCTPPTDLLEETTASRSRPPATARVSSNLIRKLQLFGVTGKLQKVVSGPVLTSFYFKPDSHVRYAKIPKLQEDLALALQARSVRILRVAGTNTVSIEVARKTRGTASLKRLLHSKEYAGVKGLSLALGVTEDGKPLVLDLAEAPHLLIAGTTGSGKSVSLHSMLMSLTFQRSANTLNLILIDPKRVELTAYAGIPHLCMPIATDPYEASYCLDKALDTIEKNYKLMKDLGVRNITGYNARKDKKTFIPYTVVIVDEVAELMMTSSRSTEDSIVRVAQLGRAAGVHLILSTQRPTVNVVTGMIKANIQTRLCFKTSSKTDSRVVLDQNGAEILLGRGDGLLRLPEDEGLVRIQSAFVSEAEVNRVVEWWKQGYTETIEI